MRHVCDGAKLFISNTICDPALELLNARILRAREVWALGRRRQWVFQVYNFALSKKLRIYITVTVFIDQGTIKDHV